MSPKIIACKAKQGKCPNTFGNSVFQGKNYNPLPYQQKNKNWTRSDKNYKSNDIKHSKNVMLTNRYSKFAVHTFPKSGSAGKRSSS